MTWTSRLRTRAIDIIKAILISCWFIALIFCFILLFQGFAHAGTGYINFGIEPVKKSGSYSDVKILTLGYQMPVKENVAWQVELGYWADKRPGSENSFYISPLLVLTLSPWIFHVEVYAGIALVAEKDIYLGGPINFHEGVFLGIRDGKARAGLRLGHISSAAIYKINRGRNAFQLVAMLGF